MRIDTCAKPRSIISERQYDVYCVEFSLKRAIKGASGESVRGIGGRQNAIGMETIQIPFKELHLIIDVEFMVIGGDIPKLLSMRDMYTNGLDISIQSCHIRRRGSKSWR